MASKKPFYGKTGRQTNPDDAVFGFDEIGQYTALLRSIRDRQRWKYRSPAMAASFTDHIWTIKELMMTVVVPEICNTI
jgi:hypothetical protein